jgi:hypothetical protein
MKQKTSQPNKIAAKKKDKVRWDEYLNLNTWKRTPYSVRSMELLAEEYLSWSKKDTSWSAEEFYLDKGIPSKQFYEWIKKYEFLRIAHKEVLTRLGLRREAKMFKKEFPEKSVMYTLPDYLARARRAERFRSRLKEKQQESATRGAVTVVMQSYKDEPKEE